MSVHSRTRGEVRSSNEPPLNGESELPDRRKINFRWMAAIVLMGGAALALLGGALRGALGNRVQFAVSPVTSFPGPAEQVVDEAHRGDRLDRKSGGPGSPSAIRIEQLSDAGSVRPFTRVSARLAQLDPEPQSVNHREPVGDGDNDQPAGEQQTPLSQLPTIIRDGASHRRLPDNVDSYVDAEEARQPPASVDGALNVTNVPERPSSSDSHRHVVIARSGDTLSGILRAVAAGKEDEQAILAAVPWPDGGEALSGGEKITIIEQNGDTVLPERHILRVSIKRADSTVIAVGRTDTGRYQAIVPEQPGVASRNDDLLRGSTDMHSVPGETLRDGLNALARSNHVDEAIVAEFMRLCSRDFDLDGPLGDADMANIIYAPNELGQPELVFVDLTAGGQTHRYYRFTASDDGSSDFYDDDGHSVTKFLLRKPVVSGRLGDGFGWRIHPILGDRRFHEGADFAAPYGSPIAAAGVGVVETIGYERGYGKYIRVLHDRGYETTYAHIADVSHGLKVGDRVRQGETIAYVGSTGLSTGPHLYYEVRINGHNVDPLRMKLSGGRDLQGDLRGTFDRHRDSIDELAAASTSPQRYFGSEHRPPL